MSTEKSNEMTGALFILGIDRKTFDEKPNPQEKIALISTQFKLLALKFHTDRAQNLANQYCLYKLSGEAEIQNGKLKLEKTDENVFLLMDPDAQGSQCVYFIENGQLVAQKEGAALKVQVNLSKEQQVGYLALPPGKINKDYSQSAAIVKKIAEERFKLIQPIYETLVRDLKKPQSFEAYIKELMKSPLFQTIFPNLEKDLEDPIARESFRRGYEISQVLFKQDQQWQEEEQSYTAAHN
jgi:hypothetical protein